MARFKYTDGERVALTPEEETARDAQEAAWTAGLPARAFAKLREKRNQKLEATDWRFRSDQTPSQEWIDYSQALRDLPAQYDDETILSEEVTWPNEPD